MATIILTDLLRAFADLLEAENVQLGHASTVDGETHLYVFGGEPDENGTRPRHAGIVDDGDGLSVVLSTFGNPDDAEFFDVGEQIASVPVVDAAARVVAFVKPQAHDALATMKSLRKCRANESLPT
jgi:hypothetical protein